MSIGIASKYITSIDGLRAFSVIFVLLFHVDYPWMTGGFIGVDSFFVISGFLITSNIVKDINNQNWQFSKFYIKRIARLFPALFTVILVTAFISYFILNPDDLKRLGQSGIYATLSLSNFFFLSESGYFDKAAITKPLLHTWSLSVEEQFYLIWPSIIYVLYKLGSNKILIIGLILISISSLIVAIFHFKESPNSVFFITPYRIYQFGAGALLALSGITTSTQQPVRKTIVGVFSIIILLYLGVSITGSDNILLTSILPALSATTFIYSAEAPLIKKIFGARVFVWIGQRSYSIYLVHWPIIVLWSVKTGTSLDAAEKIFIILISLIAGAFLHTLVEKRFRLKPGFTLENKFKTMAGTTGTLTLILLVLAHFWGNDGYPKRVPQELYLAASNLQPKWEIRQKTLRSGICNILLDRDQAPNYSSSKCMSPPPDKRSYLILGDSFASGAYLLFTEAYPEIYFGQLSIPGCRLRLPHKIKRGGCKDLYENAFEKLTNLSGFDGVIISSNWLEGRLFEIEEITKKLEPHNLDIILIGQRIRFEDRLPTIILSTMNKKSALKKSNNSLIKWPIDLNKQLRERFSGRIKFLDLIELQCPGICDIFDPVGNIMYLDDSHLSMEGVKMLAPRIREKYPNLLG